MTDLALNPNHDLLITGFDLSMVDGPERVRQQLEIKLRLWRGEWFLDTEFGTPYLSQILGKQLTLSGALAALRSSILEVDDVKNITQLTYNFSASQRSLKVDFVVLTPFGLVEVSA